MVTITLPPELEQVVEAEARRLGETPQDIVLNAVRDKLVTPKSSPLVGFEPRDEWERELFSIPLHAGVSLPDEAVSSEGLYD